jgi:hypothetical protein
LTKDIIEIKATTPFDMGHHRKNFRLVHLEI